MKSDLARYKVPREVEFLDELPRNATGKILKKELQEREDGEDGGDPKDGSSSKSKKRGGSRKKATAKRDDRMSNLASVLTDTAAEHPDNVAVKFDDAELTYRRSRAAPASPACCARRASSPATA